MRVDSLWRAVLGVEEAVIEDVRFEEGSGCVVVSVRPRARQRGRCGRCGRRCRGYDQGRGQRRRWRSLDLGTVQTWVEADSVRVRCPEHGVVVAQVPWARHDAGHTRGFDDTVAWLATQTSKTAVTQLMRVAWRTVGSVITRVWADVEALGDRFDGLRRIGIDEISYKRGHLYLMVVVDHDTGRLVWAAPGRDTATLQRFFDELGVERAAQITHVSADSAEYIAKAVARNCPDAEQCADPFHVVKWATDALDEVRRRSWNDARTLARATEPPRGRGRPPATAGPREAHARAKALKGARYALWKNPEDLTERQHTKLAWIAATNPTLHRAYLLKEGLRLIFRMPCEEAAPALNRWINWARRCRIPAFVKLQKSINTHTTSILAAIKHGLSNGRIESVNTKIRLITRIAFGFKSPHALIALAMLNLSGHRPTLPNRT